MCWKLHNMLKTTSCIGNLSGTIHARTMIATPILLPADRFDSDSGHIAYDSDSDYKHYICMNDSYSNSDSDSDSVYDSNSDSDSQSKSDSNSNSDSGSDSDSDSDFDSNYCYTHSRYISYQT